MGTSYSLGLSPLRRVAAPTLTRLLAGLIAAGLTVFVTPAYAESEAPHAAPAHSSNVDRAKESFNRGLALANAKDYRAAIAAFEQAYQLAPHYAVLYNIARSHAALRDNDQAVLFLRRYLKEGGSQVSAQRAAQIETEIADLLRQSEAEKGATVSPVPPPPPTLRITGAPPGATILLNGLLWQEGDAVTAGLNEVTVRKNGYRPWSRGVELTAGHATSVAVTMVPDRPAPAAATPIDTPLSSPAYRTVAYVLTATGLGITAGAGVLFLWNDGRYSDWDREDAALQQTIQTEGPSNETNVRQVDNNELLQSIQTVDVVTVVGGVLGLGLLGTGLYLHFSGSSTAANEGQEQANNFRLNPGLVVGPGSILLRNAW